MEMHKYTQSHPYESDDLFDGYSSWRASKHHVRICVIMMRRKAFSKDQYLCVYQCVSIRVKAKNVNESDKCVRLYARMVELNESLYKTTNQDPVGVSYSYFTAYKLHYSRQRCFCCCCCCYCCFCELMFFFILRFEPWLMLLSLLLMFFDSHTAHRTHRWRPSRWLLIRFIVKSKWRRTRLPAHKQWLTAT